MKLIIERVRPDRIEVEYPDEVVAYPDVPTAIHHLMQWFIRLEIEEFKAECRSRKEATAAE